MTHCAVLSCKNSSKNVSRDNGNVSFHRFPNDPNVKKKWIEATGQKNWFPTIHSSFCSVHFDDGCFMETRNFRRLSTTAIPTIDILKTSTNDENKDQKLSHNEPLASHTPIKIKLEKDIHKPSSSNELVHKLNNAQQIIKEKNLLIKRLMEQNRYKDKKIHLLVSMIRTVKKNRLKRKQKRIAHQKMEELSHNHLFSPL